MPPAQRVRQSFLSEAEQRKLAEAGYSIIGGSRHSAVKICLWTRKSIRGEGECYKQRFYGIESHRCLQLTPSLPFCTQRCVFCWRNTDITYPEWLGGVDDPEEIVDGAIKAQRRLLNGFPGNAKADMAKWREAQEPRQAAISLAGEPALYPELPALVRLLKARGMTSFLVTNGTQPGMLERLLDEKALPTQLYVSLAASNEQEYGKTCRPLAEDGWKKLNDSLEFIAGLGKKTRSVLRMTLAKGLNLKDTAEYAELISKASPDYVEAKAYMALGSSRLRLGMAAVPSHEEIRAFASELAGETGYITGDEHAPSRVVLLCRDGNAERKRFIKSR
jgi:tRNA wybutosine-synthesizing protein 1